MKNRAFFILFVLLSALSLWGQELAINPLELALSGVVTVAVLDTEGEDQVLGYTGARKSYADIAYEEALDMSSAFSNGSGFVIEYEGSYYVLTNVHVIDAASGKPGSIKAYSITRDEYPMKVVGGDSFYDLAILAFDGKQPGEEIHPLSFSGQEVELAQKAYAIGNPLGQYPYTITEGIISGKNRLFFRPTTGRFGFLQHTATLIWGNSGGPLVDEKGEVIGMNTWIYTRNDQGQSYIFSQLNFALEGQLANSLFQEMMKNNGRVKRAFLGVVFASAKGLLGGAESPPYIHSLIEGSPAAGVLKDRIGYAVTAVNGQPVKTLQDIVRTLEAADPGQKVTLDLKQGIISPEEELTADELTGANLEKVAQHFFKKFTDYELTEGPQGVELNGKPVKSYHRLEVAKSDTYPPENATFEVQQGKTAYGMASLGAIDNYGRGKFFRANTIQELATAIRLNSLEGHLGADLLDEGKKLQRVRFFMTDDNLDEVKVLFY
ncbi:MAG: trypsin-like peptidase domain-containing protein [Lewinellaceae bacterium]|nr:trypsin-like peptidase domain-containing protein [Phaeodactylibacter sp.]MCB9038384.1 trypsin-like peptidase domain-containing protein [Lewinellaceae bacterium]